MRYKFKTDIVMGTNAINLLRDFRDEFATIPGWEVWDDQTGLAGTSAYVVWKVTTSEGVGNEVYFQMQAISDAYFGIRSYPGWDNVAHAAVGSGIGTGRVETNANSWNITEYRYAADQDHLLLVIGPPTGIYTPTYVGLTTKLRPDYDGPGGWIMCTWYYHDGHATGEVESASYSDQCKTPVLKGQDGTLNKRSRLFRTGPQFAGTSVNGGPSGPYFNSQVEGQRRSAVYFNPLVLVESDIYGQEGTGFGPRGILKSVLCQTDALYADYGLVQPMKIGSRDYVIYKCRMGANDWYSRRNSWGQHFGAGDHEMAWAIPVNDHHVFCHIEGA